jgi:D-xylose transport system permease protein
MVNEQTPGAGKDAQSSIVASLSRFVPERLTQGDLGSLPILIGLGVIAAIFQIANHHFLSPLNLTNLVVQISAIGTISVGVVLVLLIGEIDLSVGAVSGVTAAVMAVLVVKAGWSGPVGVLAGLVAGAAIGLLQGSWFAKIHVPSFVVTLAGYLGWQGALLYVLGPTGTVNLNDPFVVGLANKLMPVWFGWALAIGALLIFGYRTLMDWSRRRSFGLNIASGWSVAGRVVIIAVATLGTVALMSVNRNPVANGEPIQGVPAAILALLFFVIIFDLILRRTRFGRAIFAVGGNVEAARRAGINVDRLRIIIFVLCSTMAAAGGILAGSRLLAVNQSSGSGDVLLNAIAAAVIGGTSLFGGRGSTWAALLGALVIGSISNGMDLLAFASSVKFMVTGAVLLLAVTVDALGHSRREQSGT